MDGEHIAPAKQLIPGHVRHPGLFGGFRRQVGAPRDDLHPEGRTDPRHPRADPAQSEHAEHRAAELAANRGLPSARAHRKCFVDDPPSGGQDQRPGQFDRGLNVAASGADVYAALRGGHHVNGGIERPSRGDHLQPRQPLDDCAGQWRSFPHDAYHVERRQPFDEGVCIGEMVTEDGDLGPGRNVRPVGHAQRDVLVVVEDRHLHRTNLPH